jgi:hypothetical protein
VVRARHLGDGEEPLQHEGADAVPVLVCAGRAVTVATRAVVVAAQAVFNANPDNVTDCGNESCSD